MEKKKKSRHIFDSLHARVMEYDLCGGDAEAEALVQEGARHRSSYMKTFEGGDAFFYNPDNAILGYSKLPRGIMRLRNVRSTEHLAADRIAATMRTLTSENCTHWYLMELPGDGLAKMLYRIVCYLESEWNGEDVVKGCAIVPEKPGSHTRFEVVYAVNHIDDVIPYIPEIKALYNTGLLSGNIEDFDFFQETGKLNYDKNIK